MALDSFVGRLNMITTAAGNTKVVTGVGFKPSVLIFWWNGSTASGVDSVGRGDARPGVGWTTGPTSRAACGAWWEDGSSAGTAFRNSDSDACINMMDGTGATKGKADLQSFDDSDGFTLVVDEQFSRAVDVGFLALAGADILDSTVGNFAMSGSLGDQSVTGVGFRPDAVLFIGIDRAATDFTGSGGRLSFGVTDGSASVAMFAYMRNAQPTTVTNSYLFEGECCVESNFGATDVIKRATPVRMDSDGFTINWTEANADNAVIHYLAIKGPAIKIGTVTTKTNGDDIVENGMGFSPDAVMFFSHGLAESTNNVDDADARTSFGAFSATDERHTHATVSQTGLSTSRCGFSVQGDAVYTRVDDVDALDAAMDIKTIGSDGMTLVMDTVDSAAHAVGYIAFGVVAGGGINTSGTLNYRRRRRMAT